MSFTYLFPFPFQLKMCQGGHVFRARPDNQDEPCVGSYMTFGGGFTAVRWMSSWTSTSESKTSFCSGHSQWPTMKATSIDSSIPPRIISIFYSSHLFQLFKGGAESEHDVAIRKFLVCIKPKDRHYPPVVLPATQQPPLAGFHFFSWPARFQRVGLR